MAFSWGAMPALAYGAAYLQAFGPMIRIGCGAFDEASRAHLTGTAIHWSIRAGWRHSPVANRLGVNNPTRSTHAGHSLAYGTTQIIGKLLVLLKH